LGVKLLNNLTQLRLTAVTIIFLFILSGTLPADIPVGYYDGAEGKVGAELKAALHNIIKGHPEFPYTSSGTDVWDILKDTDRDPDNSANVILLYTGRSVNGAQEYNDGNGWTREHVWAKSRGDFGTELGAGTDVHHLRPCDNSTNTDRNNRWFDNSYTLHYDDGIATGNYYSDTKWTWEPRDAVKGDVARMIFYMAVRYEGNNNEPDLEVVDYFPDKYSNEPLHAKLSSLLQWHFNDPVDSWEKNRNDIIYTDYQHNRNPFIDRPEFVDWIWSDTTGTGEIANLFFSEYIEGTGYNKALEIINASDKSVDLSDYAILSNSNNSPWYTTHYVFPDETVLSAGDVWVIAHSGAIQTILDVAGDTTRASVVNFSGNDVRALVKIMEGDTTYLDVIGLYDDPNLSEAWTVAGVTNATNDHTIVRKSSVRQGNHNWNISAGTNADDSEWIVYDSDIFDFLGTHTITPSSLFGLCNALDRLDNYRLYPCYPNPFNPSTTIQYDLYEETTVTLRIYDLRGTIVNTLVKERQEPGTYRVLWNGMNTNNNVVAAGVYLYQLQTIDGFIKTGKMIMLK